MPIARILYTLLKHHSAISWSQCESHLGRKVCSCDSEVKMKELILSTTVLILLAAGVHVCSSQLILDDGSSLRLANLSLTVVNSSSMMRFGPGAGVCPSSELEPPLKQNTIFIGVVGSDIDPLLSIIKEEDIPTPNCRMESYEVCSIPGK